MPRKWKEIRLRMAAGKKSGFLLEETETGLRTMTFRCGNAKDLLDCIESAVRGSASQWLSSLEAPGHPEPDAPQD